MLLAVPTSASVRSDAAAAALWSNGLDVTADKGPAPADVELIKKWRLFIRPCRHLQPHKHIFACSPPVTSITPLWSRDTIPAALFCHYRTASSGSTFTHDGPVCTLGSKFVYGRAIWIKLREVSDGFSAVAITSQAAKPQLCGLWHPSTPEGGGCRAGSSSESRSCGRCPQN